MGEDFQDYLSSLNSEYPSFLKPSTFTLDRSSKIDGSSRVRLFLKKLAKKASKNGLEGARVSSVPPSSYGERKGGEKLHSSDVSRSDVFIKRSYEDKSSSTSLQDIAQHVQPTSAHFGVRSLHTGNPDADAEEKFVSDEGTLCWNLLFSRLFFDAKRSVEINNFIKSRIQVSFMLCHLIDLVLSFILSKILIFLFEQRSLSNMRTPSYIGDITCTGLDLGTLPPYIHRMRVFPMDLNEVWSIEVDIEYSGGIMLDIETRLEVREPELQKDIIKTSLEPDSAGEVNTDFLEGIEHYGNQLKSSSNLATGMDNRNDVDKPGEGSDLSSGYISLLLE